MPKPKATQRVAKAVVEDLVSLLPLLSQVRQNIDQIIGTVDSATANRLRQLQIILEEELMKVEEVIEKGYNAANTTREKLFKQVFDVLSSASNEFQRASRIVFLQTNQTLVQVAVLLDSIPFVKVKPYLFAIDPFRMHVDATDRLISFYGHFPDVTEKKPATVTVEVDKVKENLQLQTYAGHRLSFELPETFLKKEQTFVTFTIKVPKATFRARLYVQKTSPYSFEITSRKENPALWATFESSGEHHENADSSRTSNNQTMSAPQLFSILINDNETYEMAAARFARMKHRIDAGNKPCDCCDSSSGQLSGWDEFKVSFALNAPTCGQKWCSPTYFCGGGGTHADIWLKPTFKVKRRNVAEETDGPGFNEQMRVDSVKKLMLDANWTKVEILGLFQDGDDRFEKSLTLTKGVPIATADLWSAEVKDSRLVLETRGGVRAFQPTLGTQVSYISEQPFTLELGSGPLPVAAIADANTHKTKRGAR